jgi:hypothetical protein
MITVEIIHDHAATIFPIMVPRPADPVIENCH